MKLRSLFTTLALGTAILIGSPAHAQGSDPCSVYTCMAGVSGSGASGGPDCVAPSITFFMIQVWDPYYDPGATSAARQEFLTTCPGADEPTNAAILEDIISIWGTLM
jgi:hypothetical protein